MGPHRRDKGRQKGGVDKRARGGEGGGCTISQSESDVPKAAIFHLPSRTFREPRLGLFDGICKRVDVCRERRGRRRVYARDVVVRACLRSEREEEEAIVIGELGRGVGCVLALTSRWPARPVLLTTWQRSGGPSSRKVAGSVCFNEMDGRTRWKWRSPKAGKESGG